MLPSLAQQLKKNLMSQDRTAETLKSARLHLFFLYLKINICCQAVIAVVFHVHLMRILL